MVKILVIGELCVDRFVYGVIKRLSPEAPVPVLNPIEITENEGMAGNVVSNLKALMDDIEVLHWSQSTKIEKIRFVEKKSNHMFIRVDEGELQPIDTLSYISREQRKTIKESDVVIISDYDKGYLTNDIIREISENAKVSILDSKRKLNQELIENITFIKLNESEYENNRLLVDENKDKFIITLGPRGAQYGDEVYSSANPQDTIDVSGAGDTFVAAFGLKFLKTKNISQSINYANEVCANVVNKKGVAIPDKKFKI
jgi:D-beta-D-heptose 7-phosphate kinase/D-beta-D-heptose 1-phosphate adenosyltransferase